MRNTFLSSTLVLGLGLGLSACSDKPIGSAEAVVSGIAAIGAPMANARITAIGNACERVATADANGVYSVALAGCNGSLLMRAETDQATVHSVVKGRDTGRQVNITPITEIIAARTLGTNDLSSATTVDQDTLEANIDQAKADVETVLRPLLVSFGATGDLISGDFSADGTGLDKVLDVIEVTPQGGNVSLTIKGGNNTIIINSDINVAAPDPVDADDVTQATTTASEWDAIKTVISSMNTCLRTNNRSCFLDYTHSSFLNDGFDLNDSGSDWWTDELGVSGTYYEIFLNPALIELSSDGTTAHVATVDHNYESGVLEGKDYFYMKMKKESGEEVLRKPASF